jgi:hypothetical protein
MLTAWKMPTFEKNHAGNYHVQISPFLTVIPSRKAVAQPT